jgi:cytochrome c2
MKSHRRRFLALVFAFNAIVGCERDEKRHEASQGEHHGPPKDWKFALAKGDAAEGRKVFVDLQCYKCHEVKGESFPGVAVDDKGVGPELSQMAGMHPVEFFAESSGDR